MPPTDPDIIQAATGGPDFTVKEWPPTDSTAALRTALDLETLTQVDVAASLVHDYIWQKPVLSGTTPPSQEQASDTIWTIHKALRPVIASLASQADDPRERYERDRLTRLEHEATHGEAEQCGAECIRLGLASFDDEADDPSGESLNPDEASATSKALYQRGWDAGQAAIRAERPKEGS